jgi:hypothetical protein
MKTIEKTTSDGDKQIFEVIENRKELNSFLKNRLSDADYKSNGTWCDEDSSICLVMKDSKEISFHIGDKITSYNKANICSMIEANTATFTIYGDVQIIQDENYGDWRAEFND